MENRKLKKIGKIFNRKLEEIGGKHYSTERKKEKDKSKEDWREW